MKPSYLLLCLFSTTLPVALPAGGSSPAGSRCSERPIPQLEDITARAGIKFQHTTDATKNYIPDSMGGGVLLIDYDRDGWLDVYFTNAPSVAMMLRGLRAKSALYRNNHDGTFTDVTDSAGVGFPCAAMGGAVGDFNNDGWPDMYITCFSGNVLFRNNGDGTFTDVAKQAGVYDGRWSTGAAFADYDHDGFLDLMVDSYVDLDLMHLPQPGSSRTCTYRSVPVQCGPHGLKGGKDVLFHNQGDGKFCDVSEKSGVADRTAYYGLGVLWADFDGSGLPSLFVANDSTPNYLYRNLGRGHFEEIALAAGVSLDSEGKEEANMGVTAGDYLHTGRQSIYTTTFSGEVKPLFRNDGKFEFNDVAETSGFASASRDLLGWGTSFADFDNDGWLDLMTVYGHVYPQVDTMPGAAGYREPKTLFLNGRDGTFCNASQLAGDALQQPAPARGLAVGDLFNDGNVDAVVENIDGLPLILRNHGSGGMHWISFELAGTISNRSAIGAELKLTAGGVTQTAEVRSGDSYLSQSDLRVHFGLGSARLINELQIRWPSGKIESVHQLDADRFYSILEGSGVVPRDRIIPTHGRTSAR